MEHDYELAQARIYQQPNETLCLTFPELFMNRFDC